MTTNSPVSVSASHVITAVFKRVINWTVSMS